MTKARRAWEVENLLWRVIGAFAVFSSPYQFVQYAGFLLIPLGAFAWGLTLKERREDLKMLGILKELSERYDEEERPDYDA